MAQNPLPKTVAELLDLGTHCQQGLITQGANIGILQYNPASYGIKVDALGSKQQAFNVARSNYAGAFGPVHAQEALLRRAGLDGRKILSISLGDDWSPAWVAPGWPNHTTEVPADLAGLKVLAAALAAFLTANPTFQIDTAKVDFTPGRYTDLLTALGPLVTELDVRRAALNVAREARKLDDKALRTDTRGLIALLETKLEPDSPLWDAFGLNRPGASVTPGQAALPTLTKVPGGKVLGAVAALGGATYYRWFGQLAGVDTDFRFLGRTLDPMEEIDDLPATGVLKVKVQAANEAGPGKASAVATITLGV